MKYVKTRDFARLTAEGALDRLHCKMCGRIIGETQQRTVGFKERPDGRIIERIVESFTRNNLYMEVKIAFNDGSAHVTNGCSDCLSGNLGEEILAELTQADEEEQERPVSERKPIGVVKTRLGGGIV